MQVLLAVDESTTVPVSAVVGEDEELPARIAPALWTFPALALPLADAIPWLATLDPDGLTPTLRVLALASRVIDTMVVRGDFAPAPQPGVAHFAPVWAADTQWAMAGISELVPGSLLTARFAVPDDPVYAVTQRNLLVSFAGHAIDQ